MKKIVSMIFAAAVSFIACTASAQEVTKYDMASASSAPALTKTANATLKPFALEITGTEAKGKPSQVCTFETDTGLTEVRCGKGDVVVIVPSHGGAVCFNAQAAAKAIEMKSSRIAGYCTSEYKRKG
jgi:hypothetical protein